MKHAPSLDFRHRLTRWRAALCLLLILTSPRLAAAATTPSVAIVQCSDSYREDSPSSLGGITPGAQVVSAQLLLEVYDAGDVVTIGESLSAWSQSSITYNTAPSSAPAAGSIPAGVAGSVAIDVTDVVQHWVEGAPAYGLVLEPTSSNGVRIRSTEYVESSSRPQLVIEVIQ